MKTKGIFFLFALFIYSCQEKSEPLFNLSFETDVYIDYYLFYNSACEGGTPFPVDPENYFWTSMTISVIQREIDDQIEIFDNGYLFLKGNITSETDDYIYFSVPLQDTFLNDLNYEIEGYDDVCEDMFVEGRIDKISNTIRFAITFYDNVSGQPSSVQFKYMATFSSYY